jgi:hypothetical protein
MNLNFNPMRLFSIFVLVAAIGFSGCEKVIYLDVETQENKLVVNTTLAPGDYASSRVTLSADPLALSFNGLGVSDATVTITRNGNTSFVLDNYGDGAYGLEPEAHMVEPGDALTMTVTAPGKDPVEASTTIPNLVPITSVQILDTTYKTYSYSSVDPDGNIVIIDTLIPYYQIELIFTDPEESNQYGLTILYEDAVFTVNACFTTSNPIFGLDNSWVSHNLEENGEVTICDEIRFPDYANNGQEIRIVVDVFAIETLFATEPKFKFVLSNLSDEYYSYLASSLLQEGSNGDPFSEPVVVYSNIQGGFGIFAGFTKSIAEIAL